MSVTAAAKPSLASYAGAGQVYSMQRKSLLDGVGNQKGEIRFPDVEGDGPYPGGQISKRGMTLLKTSLI